LKCRPQMLLYHASVPKAQKVEERALLLFHNILLMRYFRYKTQHCPFEVVIHFSYISSLFSVRYRCGEFLYCFPNWQ